MVMHNNRYRVATQLFLGRGMFRSHDSTWSAVRADAISPESIAQLWAINFLAGTAEALWSQADPLSAADEQRLSSLIWHRRRLEYKAAADGIPRTWIDYAGDLGHMGVALSPDHRLPTPWIDHRARLVRSIRADVNRLTTMASACVVRAYRTGVTGLPTEPWTFGEDADQLLRNMRAIRTSAARTAQAIGAEDDERRQWWHISQVRWQALIALHMSTEIAALNRWWSVYTDPEIRSHVRGFVRNLPLYAELTSPTGSRAHTCTGVWPPDPSVWLAAAATELNAPTSITAADTDPGSDIVPDAVWSAEPEWSQPPGPTDQSFWPGAIGPDP
ncbi:hypothetical protein ACQPW1_22410 [Nocardia sp. CA-128927]|uniref:hypothetical protein n=1 Tax=Nocardia sp. CA-128927 TaxID=3239975 RepID=UPI003D99903D